MTTMPAVPDVFRGDARSLPFLSDDSVQCIVTSPPYPRERVYGDDGHEIGQGTTFEAYLSEMREVGAEMRRVLRPDGTFWLNIGHKSTASGGAGGDYNAGGEKAGRPKFGKFRDPAYAERQVMDVALLTGQALQADGWRWITTIVWDKAVLERQDERHIRRPRLAHECILMLGHVGERVLYHPDDSVESGTVWRVKPGRMPGNESHAPFPPEIPRRAILLSTDAGDTVLDPFGGGHTTAVVAEALGRRGVSVDLYADAPSADDGDHTYLLGQSACATCGLRAEEGAS